MIALLFLAKSILAEYFPFLQGPTKNLWGTCRQTVDVDFPLAFVPLQVVFGGMLLPIQR